MDESMSALSLSSTKTITSKNHPPRRRRTFAEHQEKTDQRQEKIKDNNVVPHECIVEARQVLIETVTFIAEEVYLKISVPNGETTMLKYSTYGNIQKYIPTMDRCVHGIWRLILYTKNGDTLSKKSVFEKNIAESGKYIFIIEENYEIKFIVHDSEPPKIIESEGQKHSGTSKDTADEEINYDQEERKIMATTEKINRQAVLKLIQTLSYNNLASIQQQLDEADISTGPPFPSCIKLHKEVKESIAALDKKMEAVAALDQKMNVILSKMEEIMSSKKEEQLNGKNECATNEKIIETTSTSMNYEASATSVDQKLNIILSLLLPSNSMSAPMLGIQPQQQCSQQQVHQNPPEIHFFFQYTPAPNYTAEQVDNEKAIVYHRNVNQPFIEAAGSCVPQQQVHQYTPEIQQAHVAAPQRFQYTPAPNSTVQQDDNEKAIVYHRNASQPFIEAAESCVPRPLEGMYTMEAVGSSMDGGGSFTVTTVRSASEEIYTSPGIISSNETSSLSSSASKEEDQLSTITLNERECRICFCSKINTEANDPKTLWMSPGECDGSMIWVHRTCFNQLVTMATMNQRSMCTVYGRAPTTSKPSSFPEFKLTDNITSEAEEDNEQDRRMKKHASTLSKPSSSPELFKLIDNAASETEEEDEAMKAQIQRMNMYKMKLKYNAKEKALIDALKESQDELDQNKMIFVQ